MDDKEIWYRALLKQPGGGGLGWGSKIEAGWLGQCTTLAGLGWEGKSHEGFFLKPGGSRRRQAQIAFFLSVCIKTVKNFPAAPGIWATLRPPTSPGAGAKLKRSVILWYEEKPLQKFSPAFGLRHSGTPPWGE